MSASLLVNIDASDVEAARAFYCRAFGLSVGRRFGARGYDEIANP